MSKGDTTRVAVRSRVLNSKPEKAEDARWSHFVTGYYWGLGFCLAATIFGAIWTTVGMVIKGFVELSQ